MELNFKKWFNQPKNVNLFGWKQYDSPSDIVKGTDDIKAIFNRTLLGVTVNHALCPSLCEKVVNTHVKSDFPVFGFSDFGKVIGKKLEDNESGNFQKVKDDGYNVNSQAFIESFSSIFKLGLEGEIGKILGLLTKSSVVESPKGYPINFLPATIRVCNPSKGGIQHHVGNEFILKLPESQHIRNNVILQNQLSFFFILQAPEHGGELVIYPKVYKDYKDHKDRSVVVSELEHLPQLNLKPKTGDLIVFQGGDVWHKVSDIQGGKDRVTLGGILSYSIQKDKILFWS